MLITRRHHVIISGQGDVHNVTAFMSEALSQASVREGLAAVSVIGSTAGRTTIEFEPGAVSDLDAAFEKLAPCAAYYRHYLRWGDDNRSSLVRVAALRFVGHDSRRGGCLPIVAGQQIVLVEFDTRPLTREGVVHVRGEPGGAGPAP